MSSVLTQLVSSPEVNLRENRTIAVDDAPQSVAFRRYGTTTANTAQINVTAQPSPNVLISRRMVLEYDLKIVATVAATAANRYPVYIGQALASQGPMNGLGAYTDALRQFPLQSCMNSISVSLNGMSFQGATPSWYLHQNSLYAKTGTNDRDWSMCPAAPDESQQYKDLSYTDRDPLSGYANGDLTRRGATTSALYSAATSTLVAANTQATLNFLKIQEPILCSPLALFEHEDELPAFAGLTNIEINATLDGSCFNVWSRAVGAIDPRGADGTVLMAAFTGFVVTISNCNLVLKEIEPRQTYVMPKQVFYDYYMTDVRTTPTNTPLTAGSSTQTTTLTVNPKGMPRSILLWVAESQSVRAAVATCAQQTDTCCFISQCSAQLDTRNVSTTMANADFYNQAVEFGYQGSYAAWKAWRGSVLQFRPADSWGLDLGQAVGLNNRVNLSFTVNYTNISTVDIANPTIYILFIYDGYCCFSDIRTGGPAQISSYTSPLTQDDILRAQSSGEKRYEKRDPGMSGGNIFKKIGKAASKALDFVKENKLASRGLEMAGVDQKYANAAKALGMGGGPRSGRLLKNMMGSGLRDAPRRRLSQQSSEVSLILNSLRYRRQADSDDDSSEE